MKKLLTFMIVAAAALMATPEAEARPHYPGHTYVSGRTSCGCTVYSQKFISYYDRCGRPIYGHRRLAVNHRCKPVVHHRTHSNYRHHGRSYEHARYGYKTSYGRSYYSSRRKCR